MKFIPKNFNLISQDKIVAESLTNYLKRHTEMETKCTKSGVTQFFTTDDSEIFNSRGKIFYSKEITSKQISY